jgi:hypothetical protein
MLVAIFGVLVLTGADVVGGKAVGQYSVDGFVRVFLAVAASFSISLTAILLLREKPLLDSHV